MSKQTKINYSEVAAADVADFFVKGYQFKEGETLKSWAHFYDPAKGVFVFKLVTETDGEGEQA